MKKFLVVILLAFSANVFASGSLTLGYGALNSKKDAEPFSVGLYISEPIYKGFEYQSWTGTRFDNWFSSEHYIMRPIFERLKLGLGFGYDRYSLGAEKVSWKKDSNSETNYSGRVVLEIKLW